MYTHTDNFRERLIVDTSIKFITLNNYRNFRKKVLRINKKSLKNNNYKCCILNYMKPTNETHFKGDKN